MRTLDRKLLRDLWHIRGQAIAIALVIGSGLAVFIMTLGAIDSLEDSRDAYYERQRFAHVFAVVKRAPDRLAARIARISGVQTVETRIVKDVVLDIPGMDEPSRGRLVSVPERESPLLNVILIREGRSLRPGHPDEVVIGEAFAEAHGMDPGDSFAAVINGRKRQLHVVGTALSPEFVYTIAPGALMPDDKRFGILWMGREALAAALDLDGAFNDVSVLLSRGTSVENVIDRLDDILEPYGGVGAYDRSDQISNFFLQSEIDNMKVLAGVLPLIFLAVGAFLLNMVVSRLVDTEREQIGLFKALGYPNAAVGWHYLKLVLATTALGVFLGFIGGAWLARLMTELYTDFFRFPFLYYRPDPGAFAVAALISVLAAIAGALGAVRRAVRLPPAVAMVPPAPPLYRRGILARLGLNVLLDQPTLMILRQIARWPVRSGLTALGIALAVSVLFTSMQWLDSIDHLVEVYFFQAQRQEATVTLVEARAQNVVDDIDHLTGVMAVEAFRAVPVRFRFGHLDRRESLIGVSPDADLSLVLDVRSQPLRVPPEGVVLSTILADLLGVRHGELVTVEIMEGRRPVLQLPVTGLFETYIGTPAYMDITALNRMMMEGPSVSGVHLAVDRREAATLYRELKNTPAVAAVTLRRAAVDTFRDTMAETMYIMVFFYVAFACVLAFGVVYNSARISLSERGRELASLRVLGFTRGEISYILLGELTVLTMLALPLGCGLGYGLSWFISQAIENELYRIPLAVEPSTFGISAGVTVLAAAVSGLIVRRRIDRLDLIAVLKTRE